MSGQRKTNGVLSTPYMLNKKQYSTISLNSSVSKNMGQEENLYNNYLLGSYLAGLIEGDGSIYVPLLTKIYKREEYSAIEIAFDIKDFKLMSKISDTLGGGYIFIRANGKSGQLRIKDKITLLESTDSINGRMRTPKIEALHRLITWFNIKYKMTIPLLGLDSTHLKESSWLSGMLDADGNFYVTWKLNKNNLPIGLTYYLRISQKQRYTSRWDCTRNESNLPFMLEIAKLFNTRIIEITRHKKTYIEMAYEVRTDKIISKNLMFEYLNKYPLFGYKFFNQMYLEKIHQLKLSKDYGRLSGKEKLIEYKKLMSLGHKDIAWVHLNNFYKL